MKVTVIGAGNMGSAFVKQLVRAGHQVSVTARDSSKSAQLAAANPGANAVPTAGAAAGADAVVLATGSGGTQAGLMLGAALMQWSGQIYGVSVSPDYALAAQRVGKALDEASALLGLSKKIARSVPLLVDEAFKGPHYGVPNAATYQALELAARQEGVLLDPVYSGKGFAGLLAACAAGGRLHGMRSVVFLHTGGTAAMSAYSEVGATAPWA